MKATPKILLDEIAEDFNQFLKQGFMDTTSFAQKSQPNLNIDNIRKLLRIHFILTENDDPERIGVINFVRELPHRIRRIKTTASHFKNRFEGEVRGRICWKSTIDMRCSEMPKDKINFICQERERNFDIAENLVLKKLLQIISEILFQDVGKVYEGYGWLSEWFKDDKLLMRVLEDVFYRNIYLRRVELDKYVVTPRMIAKVKKSRKALYRVAANLLERYNKLMNYEFDEREARELLQNTFIKPEKTEVLFELYWAIKIVKSFMQDSEHFSFQLIEPSQSIIAEWKLGHKMYRLFHNSTGSFKFHEKLEDYTHRKNEDNFITREIEVLKTLSDITGKSSENTLWGGRPDILLEQYEVGDNSKERIETILIGEVKYTDSRDYAIQGLRELLEYIALIREESNDLYITKMESLFGNLNDNPVPIVGVLFTDKIEGHLFNFDNNPCIIFKQFGEEVSLTDCTKQ